MAYRLVRNLLSFVVCRWETSSERITQAIMQPSVNERLGAQSGDTQPNPIVGIEGGIVHVGAPRLAQEQPSEQPFWRGAMAMVIIVIIIAAALAGMLIALPPPAHGTGLVPTVTPSPSPTTVPTATATPAPALPTVSQSWGANAAQATVMMQLDATHRFVATNITPDGAELLGSEIAPTGTQIGMLVVATKAFIPFTPPATVKFAQPHCCIADSRFALITDTVVSGATCAACNVRYSAFDLDTRTVHPVAIGSSFGGITGAWLDHHLLVLQTGTAGIQIFDLTAAQLVPTPLIALSPGDPPPVQAIAFQWPDLIYNAAKANATPALRVRDLSAQTDMPLTALNATLPASVTNLSVVFTNDTLFCAYAQRDAIQIVEFDHVTTGGTTVMPLTTYPDSHGTLVAANDRLIVFAGQYPFAWDRAERHWVVLSDAATAGTAASVMLAGHFLAVIEMMNTTTAQQVTIYDTNALPTMGQ